MVEGEEVNLHRQDLVTAGRHALATARGRVGTVREDEMTRDNEQFIAPAPLGRQTS